MKLLTKTSIYYLWFSLLLFSGGGVIFYFQLRNVIKEDVVENLNLEKEKISKYLQSANDIPSQPYLLGEEVKFLSQSTETAEGLRDTMLYNELEQEDERYIQLIYNTKFKGQNYVVIISKPMFEAEDLAESVITSFAVTAALLLFSLLLFSRILSNSLMKPFYAQLKALQDFDLNINKNLKLIPSDISEFRKMNNEIRKMTGKILSDYKSLKEFTENASHELQTPLAIILSKLELIIQQEGLTEEQMKMLHEVYESAGRLARLNQSLLLLTKIENRQYANDEIINIDAVISNKLHLFDEMINHKNITVNFKKVSLPALKMNIILADILISNLIANAIRHNIETGGSINIVLNESYLSVSNTGYEPEISTEQFFERFQKRSASDSIGLGLAIVKQICDNYGFTAKYHYNKMIHTVFISFIPQSKISTDLFDTFV